MPGKKTKDIFDWNHISKDLTQEQIKELKEIYKYYHKKYWLYKKSFQHYKRMHMICNLGSVSLIVSGTIAGSITLNPIILGSISGSGVLLQTFSETKNYKRKIEMCRFAYQSYLQLMTDLRNHLRGSNFNEKELLDKCSIIDGIIIDLCPIADKYENQYNKKFIVHSTNKVDSNISDNHAVMDLVIGTFKFKFHFSKSLCIINLIDIILIL